MAYPFEPMDTYKLKRFWEVNHGVTLYNRETNWDYTFDTSKQTDKFSSLKHNPSPKSPIYRPQRPRKN